VDNQTIIVISGGHGLTIDLAAGEVFDMAGRQIHVTARQWEMLLFFVEHPRLLLTKDRLQQALWSGIPIGDEAISQAIRNLRDAMGQEAGNAMIQTVRGRGYRFAATIQKREEPDAQTVAQQTSATVAPVTSSAGTADATLMSGAGRAVALPDIVLNRYSIRDDRTMTDPKRSDPLWKLVKAIYAQATRRCIWCDPVGRLDDTTFDLDVVDEEHMATLAVARIQRHPSNARILRFTVVPYWIEGEYWTEEFVRADNRSDLYTVRDMQSNQQVCTVTRIDDLASYVWDRAWQRINTGAAWKDYYAKELEIANRLKSKTSGLTGDGPP